jgi:hypothetical protein
VKITLIVIGCLVLLILCVLVIGAALPKRHVTSRSAQFRATPEQLYVRIAGPQEWRPDVQKSETIHDSSGRELMRETSKRGETVTYEILDNVSPKSLTRRIATQNLPYSGSWTYSLEPVTGGGTRVRITEDGEVYNPVFRLVSRFILGQTKTMDDYLNALAATANEKIKIE